MFIPNFDHAHPKMIEIIFTFPEFHQYAKTRFIPSIHSWDTVNFRVPWPDWPHTFLTTPTSKVFDQLLIYVNWICINMQNIKLFHWFVLETWLIKKPAIWLAQNILADISGIKIFPNMRFVEENSKWYKVSL